MSSMTNFEEFIEIANKNPEEYRKKLTGNGSFDYAEQINQLQELSNKLSYKLMVHWFGEQIGEHLFVKFVNDSDRNILKFFSALDYDYKFFILYELKTVKSLYAYA